MSPLSSVILFEPSASGVQRVSLFRLATQAGEVVDVEEAARRVEEALAQHEALQRDVEAALAQLELVDEDGAA